jgi:hypothetical protein
MKKILISANDWPNLGYIPVEERYSINVCSAPGAVVLFLFIAGVKYPRRDWNTPPYGREHRRPSLWVSSLTLQSHWGNLPPNNNSSIHNSHLLEEWLSRQADIELSDWPPRWPDLNIMNVNMKEDKENNAGYLA